MNRAGSSYRSRDKFERLLLRWFPVKVADWSDEENQVIVVDLQEQRVASHLELSGVNDYLTAFLTPDARILVTGHGGNPAEACVQCWELPIRKPWLWILGPPLILGAVPFAWKLRHYRRVKRRTSDNANPHFLAASSQFTAPVDKS